MSTRLPDLKSHPALAFPREDWKSAAASERHARMRKRLGENGRFELVRARLATEAYRQTEGQPMPLRQAAMMLHLVRNMPIAIHPDEVIAGNRSLLPRMGVIAPEGAVNWIDEELDILPTRPQDPFNIDAPESRRSCAKRSFLIGVAQRLRTLWMRGSPTKSRPRCAARHSS